MTPPNNSIEEAVREVLGDFSEGIEKAYQVWVDSEDTNRDKAFDKMEKAYYRAIKSATTQLLDIISEAYKKGYIDRGIETLTAAKKGKT